MSNEELVGLMHRLGEDALLASWNWRDDSVYVCGDFWKALSELLAVLGLKAVCPLCKDVLVKEQEHGTKNC